MVEKENDPVHDHQEPLADPVLIALGKIRQLIDDVTELIKSERGQVK